MTKPHEDWHVLPHGELAEIDEGILTVVGHIKMPLMDLPRRIFRSRRRGTGYEAAVIEASGQLTPGTVTVAEVWHDDDCRRPQGGPCSCGNPEVRIRPLDDPLQN